jgi:hypothetical protein
MKFLFVLMLLGFQSAAFGNTLVSFSKIEDSGFWRQSTDQLLGGQSKISMEFLEEEKLGQLKGEFFPFDGAFARYAASPLDGSTWDLSKVNKLVLEIQGDGRTYSLVLQDRVMSYGGSPFFVLKTDVKTSDELQRVEINLSDLRPFWKGIPLAGATADLSQVAQIGFQIDQGDTGPFTLKIKSISVE